MINKLTKEQFTTLAERNEDIKALRKAAREYKQEDDIRAISQIRADRVRKAG